MGPRIMLACVAVCLAAALLSSCGGGGTVTPPPLTYPSPHRGSIRVEGPIERPTVVVTSTRRYVEGRWNGGGHTGPLVLVSRRPASGGRTVFRLRLGGAAPKAPVRLQIHEYLPFEVQWSATIRRNGRVEAPDKSLTTVPGIVGPVLHVAPQGSDGGSGDPTDPLRSITAAIEKVGDGGTILVAPGRYDGIRDTAVHSKPVTVVGTGTQPIINGIELYGAQNVRFQNIAVRGRVIISSHPVLKNGQPSAHIALRDVSLSDASTYAQSSEQACIQIRAGAHDVSVDYSVIEGCGAGIGSGGPTDAPSRNIDIRGSLLQNFSADAVQFGRWEHVTFEHNLIRAIHDPRHFVHNDAIQLIGGVHDLSIVANEIADSSDQLLFFQDGPSGPNSEIRVADNLIHGAGAWAIQSQGVTGAQFVGNTIWSAHFGALIVRRAPFAKTSAHDTVVANNLFDGFHLYEGATARVMTSNITRRPPSYPGVRVATPSFANAAGDDFRLLAGSPGWHGADRRFASRLDLFGVRRGHHPNIGAIG